MKKVYLLCSLIISGVFISCSSDDDNNDNNDVTDSIIASWRLTHESNDGDIANLYDVGECTGNTTYIVKSDNTSVYSEFYHYQTEDNCTAATPQNISWENIGNNTYRFVYLDDEDDAETAIATFTDNTLTLVYSGDYIEVYSKTQ